MRKHWQSRSACRYAVTSVSVYTPEALDESGYEALDEPALDEHCRGEGDCNVTVLQTKEALNEYPPNEALDESG